MPTTKAPLKKKLPTKSRVVKKTTIKKSPAKRKTVAKKKPLIKRILGYKIKGWISRKSLLIGLGVLVLAVGSFAGYSLWQGLNANAGGVCTLGRSGTSRGGKYSTASDTKKYNECVANEKKAAAEAAARAKAVALAQAQAQAAAKQAAIAAAAKADAQKAAAAQAQAAAAAAAAAAAKAASIGWTQLGTLSWVDSSNNVVFSGSVAGCKVGDQVRTRIITNVVQGSGFAINVSYNFFYLYTTKVGDTFILPLTKAGGLALSYQLTDSELNSGYSQSQGPGYSTTSNVKLNCA